MIFVIIGLNSCTEDDDSSIIDVNNESITMGVDYINDIYYSLKNGVVAEVPRTNWDIAFNVNARSSSILINEGAGVELKVYPTSDGWTWSDAIDTTGYSTWDLLNNSEESWEEAAFSQNATEHPNYGWGEYNSISHDVEGVALYIIKLGNGVFKRIFIEIKNAMDQEYIIKYSDIDGENEVTKIISFADVTSNYIYYSIENESAIDNREPDASTWDLLFTKYLDMPLNYVVTGIKQNIGVLAIDEDNVLDLAVLTYLESEFDDNITEIGHDWKDVNMETYLYEIDSDRMYFVKDQNEKVYKIVFTGFEGMSTGNITFDITPL